VALLFILCVSGRSASSASDGCPDKGSGSGIAIPDIVTDNGARYAPSTSRSRRPTTWASPSFRHIGPKATTPSRT